MAKGPNIMSKKFTIELQDHTFTSDEDGFLNLNEIRRTLNLSENKRPTQWKSKIKDNLIAGGNIHLKEIKHLGAGTTTYWAGDEFATINYAMWVDFDFHRLVVDAFIDLRNGRIDDALKKAEKSKGAESYYYKKASEKNGMAWFEACQWSGIKNPNKCREMLLAHPRFTYFEKNGYGKYVVKEEGVDTGYFYNKGNKFTSATTMRISKEGREWLKNNEAWFNKQTDIYSKQAKKPHPF